MKTVTHLLAIFLIKLFIPLIAIAQNWAPVPSLPAIEFSCITFQNETLYACSNNRLFASYDDGNSWNQDFITNLAITPTCIKVINEYIYVGTIAHGVFKMHTNNQQAWVRFLNNLPVSDFELWGNQVYASTTGFGIYRETENGWINYSNQLPNYSQSVYCLEPFGENLLAFAGSNGTYYVLNEQTNAWEEAYYFNNSLYPGYSIDYCITDGESILAARGNHLIRMDQANNNWIADTEGLQNGLDRTLARDEQYLYCLTKSFNPAMNEDFTIIHRRARGTTQSWELFENYLPLYIYDMETVGNRLYFATFGGLYTMQLPPLSVAEPNTEEYSLRALGNTLGDLEIISSVPAEMLQIFDLSGLLVWHTSSPGTQFKPLLKSSGIYIARAVIRGQSVGLKFGVF